MIYDYLDDKQSSNKRFFDEVIFSVCHFLYNNYIIYFQKENDPNHPNV